VDPVAEADVYLAYGRDLQAEEILKEAMRSTPTRVAIHNKLLEIYAKRRDAKAFEVVATEAYGLTQGQGPEWEQACALGRELDPANPLYQPGGAPAVKAGAVPIAAGGAMNTIPFGSSTLANATGPGAGTADLDLDLDFSIDDSRADLASAGHLPAPAEAAMSGLDDLNRTEMLTSNVEEKAGPSSMSMDFDLDFPSEPVALDMPPAGEVSVSQAPAENTPTFDDGEVLPDFSLDEPQPMALSMPDEDTSEPAAVPAIESQPSSPAELMSFDLNDISLDLGDQAVDASTAGKGLTEESPLDTKLSLAEEFRAIGDLEGARSLAEEVLAEASGTLKTKASTFLADLV
jgi:pilus assembly protein FimV